MKKILFTILIGAACFTSCDKDEDKCQYISDQYTQIFLNAEEANSTEAQVQALIQEYTIRANDAGCTVNPALYDFL